MLREHSLEELLEIGGALAGRPADAARPASGGGNNRLFRLLCGGTSYALKFYPPQEDDPRDRLGAEWRALSFLADEDVAAVPHPIARDEARHCALYDWIDGTPPGPATAGDVDALASFLVGLQGLRDRDGADAIGPASAACFAPMETARQLEERLGRVTEVASAFPDLEAFLRDDLSPAVRALAESLPAADTPLPPERRALSPSDFGLHNALRRRDGSLAFLDFEYFGWDDPVKAMADVMLHPGMDLPPDLAARFLDRTAPEFAGRDPGFEARFEALFPLYALIWCLIILNEFLPERWKRRDLGGRQADGEAVRARQLARAKTRFDNLRETLRTDL